VGDSGSVAPEKKKKKVGVWWLVVVWMWFQRKGRERKNEDLFIDYFLEFMFLLE
jgi:hypothetical protein